MTPIARTKHGTPITEMRPAPPFRCGGKTYKRVDALCAFRTRGWAWVTMLERDIVREGE